MIKIIGLISFIVIYSLIQYFFWKDFKKRLKDHDNS